MSEGIASLSCLRRPGHDILAFHALGVNFGCRIPENCL